jgi:hypothetical protein
MVSMDIGRDLRDRAAEAEAALLERADRLSREGYVELGQARGLRQVVEIDDWRVRAIFRLTRIV